MLLLIKDTYQTIGGHNDEEVDAHEKNLQVALKKYGVTDSEFVILGFGEGRDFNTEIRSARKDQ